MSGDKAFAIKFGGKVLIGSIGGDESQVKRNWCIKWGSEQFKHYELLGYSCVPILITEIKEQGKRKVRVFAGHVEINSKQYKIQDGFLEEDFNYVKEAYRKDPEMKKAEYYVTLIEQ